MFKYFYSTYYGGDKHYLIFCIMIKDEKYWGFAVVSYI